MRVCKTCGKVIPLNFHSFDYCPDHYSSSGGSNRVYDKYPKYVPKDDAILKLNKREEKFLGKTKSGEYDILFGVFGKLHVPIDISMRRDKTIIEKVNLYHQHLKNKKLMSEVKNLKGKRIAAFDSSLPYAKLLIKLANK